MTSKMNNVYYLPDRYTWETMLMLKRHIKDLKKDINTDYEDIARNEGALRFFMSEIIEPVAKAA